MQEENLLVVELKDICCQEFFLFCFFFALLSFPIRSSHGSFYYVFKVKLELRKEDERIPDFSVRFLLCANHACFGVWEGLAEIGWAKGVISEEN